MNLLCYSYSCKHGESDNKTNFWNALFILLRPWSIMQMEMMHIYSACAWYNKVTMVNVILYIVRHGESASNVKQVVLDPFDDTLTEMGKSQAKVLGNSLKDVSFDRVYTSDLPRALETAEIIVNESVATSRVDVKKDVRLRERDYWTGLLGRPAYEGANLMIESMKSGTPYLKVEIPNCETNEDYERRIMDFLSDLLCDLRGSTEKEETVLLVSHGLSIQRLMILLNNRAEELNITAWTRSSLCEKLIRNTAYHKLSLEVPNNSKDGASARVEHAHCQDHITGDQPKIKNAEKYDDHETTNTSCEDEISHYCKPM